MPSTTARITENERTLSSICIAASILTGLAWPSLSAALFPFIFHFLFMAVAFSLAALNAHFLEIVGRVDRTCRIALAWQMLGIPAIVTVLCSVFDSDPVTTAILVTTTTAGSVFASPVLADLVGLDRGAAIRATILSTALMPLSLLIFGALNGLLPPEMSPFSYLQHIVYFLIAPMVIAAVYWEVSPSIGRRTAEHAERLMHWGATLALMGFCLGVMWKLHGSELQDGRILHYILLVTATVLTIYLATALLFARLGWRSAVTIGMLAANRNVALSCALIGEVLPDDVLLYVAVAQFPIFLSPLVIRMFHAALDAGRRARHPLAGARACYKRSLTPVSRSQAAEACANSSTSGSNQPRSVVVHAQKPAQEPRPNLPLLAFLRGRPGLAWSMELGVRISGRMGRTSGARILPQFAVYQEAQAERHRGQTFTS